MHRTILAAILAVAALPAIAGDHARFAAERFNQDIDRPNERIALDVHDIDRGVTVSTRSNSALSRAVELFNADIDQPNERVTANELNDFSGTPAHGAEIFARLFAEDDENNNF